MRWARIVAWLTRLPVTEETAGSNPVVPATNFGAGSWRAIEGSNPFHRANPFIKPANPQNIRFAPMPSDKLKTHGQVGC